MSYSFSLPSSPPPSYKEATRKAILEDAKSNRWSEKFTRTETSLGLNKNCIVWKVVDNNTDYKIELNHSTFGGKRVIKINGVEYINEKKFFETGSQYDFTTKDNTILTITIQPGYIAGFIYEIFVNKCPFRRAKLVSATLPKIQAIENKGTGKEPKRKRSPGRTGSLNNFIDHNHKWLGDDNK